MKKILFGLLILGFFSCGEKRDKDIYLGKLDEIIVGDFVFHLDSLTKSVYEIKVVKEGENEYLLTTKSALEFAGWAFVFTDPISGYEVKRIEIPYEGPESMKGGILGNIVLSKNLFFVMNREGVLGEYDQNGQQIRIISSIKNNFDSIPNIKTSFSFNREIEYIGDSILQLKLRPKLVNPPGLKETKFEFPENFTEWIISINLTTQLIEKSNFNIPDGYEEFKNDLTATNLFGVFDSNRIKYYLCWPGSNEIYVLKGVNLIEKVIPESNVELNFKPREVERLASGSTYWALPKEASKNVFLLYDEKRDLILKCTKINESGAGETKFERTKHYVLSIYSGEWEPLGEYLFDFESELDLENWFLTSEGLFINKPEQKSEDEYVFYKIDLSLFKD